MTICHSTTSGHGPWAMGEYHLSTTHGWKLAGIMNQLQDGTCQWIGLRWFKGNPTRNSMTNMSEGQ